VRKRCAVADLYEKALAPIKALRLPHAEPWARANWFIYVVRVAADVDRDALMRFLAMPGSRLAPTSRPSTCNRSTGGSLALSRAEFPVCEGAAATTLALPFFNDLTAHQVGLIAGAIEEGVHARVTTYLPA